MAFELVTVESVSAFLVFLLGLLIGAENHELILPVLIKARKWANKNEYASERRKD